jgi:hypothetical protein
MFTYTAKEPPYQVDLILKLSGQTKLWFMDIHILLVTVGSWKNHVWSFDALLAVRVQIGFFTVKASYGLHYTIADQRKQGARSTMGIEADEGRESEQEWLAYRRAFATGAVA